MHDVKKHLNLRRVHTFFSCASEAPSFPPTDINFFKIVLAASSEAPRVHPFAQLPTGTHAVTEHALWRINAGICRPRAYADNSFEVTFKSFQLISVANRHRHVRGCQ